MGTDIAKWWRREDINSPEHVSMGKIRPMGYTLVVKWMMYGRGAVTEENQPPDPASEQRQFLGTFILNLSLNWIFCPQLCKSHTGQK